MSESSKAEVFLQHALQALAPLVQAGLREGITYPQFAQALKATFYDAARAELAAQGRKRTDSAVSVLSGVHRKDVKALGGSQRRLPLALSVASQVYTRWLSAPDLTDASGQPRPLPRNGPAPSFEALARAVTTNVHPRTVLDELLRLKLATLDGDRVLPAQANFIPAAGYTEMAAFLAANVGDHAAAAAANLAGQSPPLLEQSVFADGLTPESVELLAVLARQAWKRVFDDTVALATQRVERDRELEGKLRMRLGVYFYAAPEDPVANGAPDLDKDVNP